MSRIITVSVIAIFCMMFSGSVFADKELDEFRQSRYKYKNEWKKERTEREDGGLL